MNKKLATLFLAIGLGAASSQALASCFECHRQFQACVANGFPLEVCGEQQMYCNDRCS